MRSPSTLRKLPGWFPAVADQAVVAVTNFGWTLVVARTAGVSTLGRFALLMTTMFIFLGIQRTLLLDPYLASSPDGTGQRMHVPPELRYFVFCFAPVSGLALLAVVHVITEGGAWYLAGLVMALWALQDAARFIEYRRGRAVRALLSDGALATCALLVLVVGITVAGTRHAMAIVMLAWSLGMLAGCLMLRRVLLGNVSSHGALLWWRRKCAHLARALAQDSFAYTVGTNLSLYLLAAKASTTEVGLVRLVSSVFSPLSIAFTGFTMWLVPVLVAQRAQTSSRGVRTDLASSKWMALGAVPILILAVLIGPPVAEFAFGSDARLSRMAIFVGGLSTCVWAIGAPLIAGAKVRQRYGPVAWSRTTAAIVSIAALLLVPAMLSATGYLALLAIQSVAVVSAAWAVVRSPDVHRGNMEAPAAPESISDR